MPEQILERVATRFRALGEVSRLRLIFSADKGKMNVTELIAISGLSQANVSKHLRILTNAGLLIRQKKGIFVRYSTPGSTASKLCALASASLGVRSVGRPLPPVGDSS